MTEPRESQPHPAEQDSTWLLTWSLASVLLGLITSFIPWGPKEGFHGTGFPIPVVMWDQLSPAGPLGDAPNPIAYILNPVLIFVFGLLSILLYRCTRWVATSLRPPASPPPPKAAPPPSVSSSKLPPL